MAVTCARCTSRSRPCRTRRRPYDLTMPRASTTRAWCGGTLHKRLVVEQGRGCERREYALRQIEQIHQQAAQQNDGRRRLLYDQRKEADRRVGHVAEPVAVEV